MWRARPVRKCACGPARARDPAPTRWRSGLRPRRAVAVVADEVVEALLEAERPLVAEEPAVVAEAVAAVDCWWRACRSSSRLTRPSRPSIWIGARFSGRWRTAKRRTTSAITR